MDAGTKVVAYARVSSKEQAQKELSIPYQLGQIRKYCLEHEYKLVGEYVDQGKSAKSDDRPEFQRMIGVAKTRRKNFDVIMVHKVDRFSRNNEDHVIYKALLRQYGVRVVSVAEPYDEDTPHGFLSNGILQLISQFYNMNLANEVRKGMETNARLGYHNGGIPPYGYTAAKIVDAAGNPKSIWVPGEMEDVNIIRRIFDMYVYENKGLKKIVNTLNTESIPSPNNGLWSVSTIWSILHNESYVGTRIWNKTGEITPGKKYRPEREWIVKPDAHEPLISRELFHMVKEKASQRDPQGKATWTRSGPSPFILRGILKCPDCGTNMLTGQNSRKCRGYTQYYHCGQYARMGSGACKRNQIAKQKIEPAVIEALVRELSVLAFPGQLEEELIKHFEESNRDYEYELHRARADIFHLERKIEIASREPSMHDIAAVSRQNMEQYATELRRELITCKEQVGFLEENMPVSMVDTEAVRLMRDGMRDFIKRIHIEPPDEQWNMVKRFVDYVRFDRNAEAWVIGIRISDGGGDTGKDLQKKLYFAV